MANRPRKMVLIGAGSVVDTVKELKRRLSLSVAEPQSFGHQSPMV